MCFSYRQLLSVHLLKLSWLPELLVYEVSFRSKPEYFVTLYCSHSQNHNSFQDVLKKIGKLPDTSIHRRDFNVIF